MASLADYLRTNPNKSSIQPTPQVKSSSSISTANPSAVAPVLATPAAKEYIQNQNSQTSSKPDTTAQMASIQAQITDKQAQMDALKTNNLTDTSQLQKVDGKYAPTAYEGAKADYTKAYEDYIKTLNPSTEVTGAKDALNKFTTDENTALQNISDQAIPMRFITGQQKSLEARAQNQQNFLQGNVTNAQTAQTARQNAGLAGVSLKEKLLGLEQSPADLAKANATATQQTFDNSLAQKKFEEDKRQFGLTYALDQQKVANAGAGGSDLNNAVIKQNALQDAADAQTISSAYQNVQSILAKYGTTPDKFTAADASKMSDIDVETIAKAIARMQNPDISRMGGDAGTALSPTSFGESLQQIGQAKTLGKKYLASKVVDAVGAANSIYNQRASGSSLASKTTNTGSEEEQLKAMGYTPDQIAYIKSH